MNASEKKNPFLLNIRSLYPSFTKAEKRIADYVLDNYMEVRFMSMDDLASVCGVSLTSVFRFCKALKLSGYQEFRIQLSMGIQSDGAGADSENELLPAEVTRADTVETMVRKLIQVRINTLNETLALLNEQAIQTAAEYINAADQVRFFGTGGSQLTAMEGMYKFLHIMPNVYCLADAAMQTMAASTLNEHDVAIFVSYSGSNRDLVEMARKAHDTGARTIGITQFSVSPLTEHMDVVLLCGGYEPPLQEGAFPSKTAHMLMLDILFTEVYRTKFDYSKDINALVTSSIVGQAY